MSFLSYGSGNSLCDSPDSFFSCSSKPHVTLLRRQPVWILADHVEDSATAFPHPASLRPATEFMSDNLGFQPWVYYGIW